MSIERLRRFAKEKAQARRDSRHPLLREANNIVFAEAGEIIGRERTRGLQGQPMDILLIADAVRFRGVRGIEEDTSRM